MPPPQINKFKNHPCKSRQPSFPKRQVEQTRMMMMMMKSSFHFRQCACSKTRKRFGQFAFTPMVIYLQWGPTLKYSVSVLSKVLILLCKARGNILNWRNSFICLHYFVNIFFKNSSRTAIFGMEILTLGHAALFSVSCECSLFILQWSHPSANCSLQKKQIPQGFHILHGVESPWRHHSNWF